MAHLVRFDSDHVELPHLSLHYPFCSPLTTMAEGLEAWGVLRKDLSLQSLPLPQRQEVSRFLQQLGRGLFERLFPGDVYPRLGRGPLLLQISSELQACPWELLHDGAHWLALSRGILRYTASPLPSRSPPSAPEEMLRVLALSAHPLNWGGEGQLGTRFIPVLDMLVDTETVQSAPVVFRSVEHATPYALQIGLERAPGLVYFSGFSDGGGWYLEGMDQGAEQVSREWLAQQLAQAAQFGLRGLVLNDSLGLLEPEQAAGQTALLLQAGLPSLVRIQGRLAQRREQDYLRTLVAHLASHEPLAWSPFAAIRRLHRRFAESWDWSFVQLFQRAFPEPNAPVVSDASLRSPLSEPLSPALSPRAPRPPENSAGSKGLAARFEKAAPEKKNSDAENLYRPDNNDSEHPFGCSPGFVQLPPPPVFRRKRRVFGREEELKKLASALIPEHDAASPLVCLSGPPGSGKTVLALEVARRIHGHFFQVVYLHDRDVLPYAQGPARPSRLEPPPPKGETELFIQLARHLELSDKDAQSGQDEALAAQLALAPPRLIIIDGLETHPGYYDFCRRLQGFPSHCRVLLIGRKKPPLLRGAHLHLSPLGAAELGRVFHHAFPRRIAAHPLGEGLLRACGTDLSLARMLWRLQRWPLSAELAPLLPPVAPEEQEEDVDTGALLELVLQAVLRELSRDARSVLEAVGMFTFLVHHEVLSQLTGMDTSRLGQALAELQWTGLVDAYDSERYYGLQWRLQCPTAQILVTSLVYQRIRPLLVRCCQSWLAEQEAFASQLASRSYGGAYSPLCWGETPPNVDTALVRRWHRLGIERIQLAELGCMLAEEQEWQVLARLVASAAFVQGLPGMEDLNCLLQRLQLAAAGAMDNIHLQAAALMALARPLLQADRPAEAQPLLEHALRGLGNDPAWEQLAETYLLLSCCYDALGRTEAAINMLHAAEELGGQLHHPHFQVEAVSALVRIWREQGDAEQSSQALLERTIHSLEHGGDHLHAAKLKILLAGSHSRSGRHDEAQACLNQAGQTLAAAEACETTYDALLLLAEGYVLENLPAEAMDAFRQARECGEGFRFLARECEVLEAICRLYELQQCDEDALDGYLLLRGLLEMLGKREILLAVLDRIGGLYYKRGEPLKSTAFYQQRLQLKETISQP